MTSKKIIRLSADPEGFGSTPDELDAGMFVEAPAAQHTHSYFEDDDRGLYVGVWDTTDMIESAGPYGSDEFMLLLEGEVSIRNNKTGAMDKVSAGQAFVIPKGYDCQWHQQGYLRKFYVISEHPDEPVPDAPAFEGIIIPSGDDPVEPVTGGGPFGLHDGIADQKSHIAYQDGTGRFLSGTLEFGPSQSDARPALVDGFAYVHSGSLTLIDDLGQEELFQTGDAFFIPRGVVYATHTIEKTGLIFASLSD